MKIYWCGPTMGKTTAAKINSDIVDFDDVIREPLKKLAECMGTTPKQMKIDQHPAYELLFLSLIKTLQQRDDNKRIVLVSNTIGLKHPYLFDAMMIPTRYRFIIRNVSRGATLIESVNWYNDLINKYNVLKLCIIEDRFVSDIF